jgi:gliding motility-associated protein GldE
MARLCAPVYSVLIKLWWPVSSLLMKSGKITTMMSQTPQQLSVDDLEQALELTDKEDIADEQQMLKGIIRFGGEMAREVMTPRVDMVDLDVKTPFPEVIQCIVENNYSRIPVYAGNEDHITGILYIKDLLPHLNKPANFRWQTLVRPATFVPETKMIDDLLRDFQAQKVHIAIVVDEFGGTSGLVTLEDIIEEIVGEINDEYDEEERTYTRLNQNTYIFEAKTLLSDFRKIMQLDDNALDDVAGDADTLAGLLLEIKGEFPQEHERIRHGRFTFEIMEMDERRIVKIKVIVGKTENAE